MCQSSGIEDATGSDGLTYLNLCSDASQFSAVRFYRPAPSARLQLTPRNQGFFFSPGDEKSYQFTIQNNGELGTDTYDFTNTSTWSLALFESNGTTPLIDTDADTIIDSGAIPQGGSKTFIAKVQAPGSAKVGDESGVSVTAKSSINTSKSYTTYLQGAIPARFAQVFMDTNDGIMKFSINKSASQVDKSVSGTQDYGGDLAMINSPNGNFIYAWSTTRTLPNTSIWVSEIYYAILDHNGSTLLPPTKLNDYSSEVNDTNDFYPSLAVTPANEIGLVWTHVSRNNATSEFNENVYFTVFDETVSEIVSQTNLTNNTVWGQWQTADNPTYTSNHITATPDFRFTIAWDKDTNNGAGTYYEEVEYTIRSNTGTEILSPTQIAPNGYSVNLAPLAGNNTLLTYSSSGEIYYVVLNSSGSTVKSATSLDGDGFTVWDTQPDAALLSDGKILVAWTGDNSIRFSVLDGSYNTVVSPITLINVGTMGGDDFVSVAPAENGQAILTWMTWNTSKREHLYYALVDSSGTINTKPMIYKTSQSPSNPYIVASTTCQGNAAYVLTLELPEIDVLGNGQSIADGDNTPSSSDHTDFGAVFLGFIPGTETFTIQNTGTEVLNLVDTPKVQISGAQATDFTITSQPASPMVPSGGSTNFTVSFTPGAAGLREATITIGNDDLDENPYTFDIQGTGVYGTFSDVPSSHWAFQFIETIADAGLTSGYPDGTYRPENPVTRAEMAVFLLNGMSITAPPINGSHPFSDIAGHWAEKFIEELFDQGITGGYPDGTYRPENLVTRAEMAVFLLKGISVTPPPMDGSDPFTDINLHWAEIFIEELYDQGITGGYPDGTYRPENRVTRAEMAVFLVNTFNIPLP